MSKPRNGGRSGTRISALPLESPALFLRAAAALLGLEGDDALLAEARAAAQGITAALPNDEMRRRFRDAGPVRLLGRLR